MVTVVISTILSSKLSGESIYTLKLVLRNIHLKEGTASNIMESIFIKDVYSSEYDSINISDNFNEVVNKVVHGRGRKFPVVNNQNELVGIILTETIKDSLFEKDSLKDLLIASDLLSTNFDKITLSDNCQLALDKMKHHDYDGLAVVESPDSNKLIGMVWRKDIQGEYDKEVERRDISSSLASKISMKGEETSVHFLEGYMVAEISPPGSFIGHSIRELNIRAKYGVDILSIKTRKGSAESVKAIPDPNHIIEKDELLVIAGESKNINVIKHLV